MKVINKRNLEGFKQAKNIHGEYLAIWHKPPFFSIIQGDTSFKYYAKRPSVILGNSCTLKGAAKLIANDIKEHAKESLPRNN